MMTYNGGRPRTKVINVLNDCICFPFKYSSSWSVCHCSIIINIVAIEPLLPSWNDTWITTSSHRKSNQSDSGQHRTHDTDRNNITSKATQDCSCSSGNQTKRHKIHWPARSNPVSRSTH